VSVPGNVRLGGRAAVPVTAGDVRENLSGIRRTLTEPSRIHADKQAVPILGEVDVVVVGGGTGGHQPAFLRHGRGPRHLC